MILDNTNTIESSTLHILFQIQNNIYTIKNRYVTGIIGMPDDITRLPLSHPEIYGICSFDEKLITVVNTPYLLNLTSDTSKQLIVLSSPFKIALLVENMIGVEKSQNMLALNKSPCLGTLIDSYYLLNRTKQIVEEIDIRALLNQYPSIQE